MKDIVDLKYIVRTNGLLKRKRKIDTYGIMKNLPVELDSIDIKDTSLIGMGISHSGIRTEVKPLRRYGDDMYCPVDYHFQTSNDGQLYRSCGDTLDVHDDDLMMLKHVCSKARIPYDNTLTRGGIQTLVVKHTSEDIKIVTEDDFKRIESDDSIPSMTAARNLAEDNYILIDGSLWQKSLGLFLDRRNGHECGRIVSNMDIHKLNLKLHQPSLLQGIEHIHNIGNSDVYSYLYQHTNRFRINDINYIDDISFMDELMKSNYGRLIIQTILESVDFRFKTVSMPIEIREQEQNMQMSRILEKYDLQDMINNCINNNYNLDECMMVAHKIKNTEFAYNLGTYMSHQKGRSQIPSDSSIMHDTQCILKRFIGSINVSDDVPNDQKMNFFISDRSFKMETMHKHQITLMPKL